MPSPAAFLQAFHLKKQKQLPRGAMIDQLKILHTVIETYRKYAFPIQMTIISPIAIDPIVLMTELTPKNNQTVLSQYGNPYNCWIDNWRVLKTSQQSTLVPEKLLYVYVVSAMGHAVRQKQ